MYIKEILIKADTFRIFCGKNSIDIIKSDRAPFAPSPIILQTIIIRFLFLFFFSYVSRDNIFLYKLP